MAVESALVVPGQIALNPTDLTTAFPHGGTEVGKLLAIVGDWDTEGLIIPQEESGHPADVIYSEGPFRLSCFFAGWEDAATTLLWPNTSVGASSGKRVIHLNGAYKDGTLMSGRAVSLVFSPYDTANHRGVYLPRCIPAKDPDGSFEFLELHDFGFPVVFTAMEDAGGDVGYIGLLADLNSLI